MCCVMEERHDCRKTEKGDSPAEFMERHGESMRRMRFTYQSGDQPLEGYTIQRGIHSGGFGEVYLARSHGGKEVALKRIHHADPDIEIRGVTQCLNLKHPNLISLFDVKKDVHGDCWVVMEYVSGTNLEDVLASFPQGLPLEEVRDWLTGFVSGIAFLHDQGIVHRDLKPANIYRESGIVKVGDVGLSKQFDEQRRKHTQSVGTVYYMAPEVARGQYGPEVDVYSAGVILYELISGKLPFNGESTGEILMKHLVAQPDLTAIPPKLRAPLSRALEKDPAKRTRSVKLLEADFLKALGTPEDAMPIPESAFHSTTTSAKSSRPTQSRSYEANRPQHVETRAIKSSTTRRIHRTILFGILIGFGLYILRSNQTIAGGLSNLSIGSLVVMASIGGLFTKLWFRREQQ